MKILIAAAACAALAGCASITRGSTEQVTVTTEPPGAAVRTSMNYACPQSPCTFQVGRKDEFIVTASKPGYQDASMPVKTKVAGNGGAAFAGNVLVGGLIGMGVDASTGAALDHYPNPVLLKLEPVALAQKAEPAKRSPRKLKGETPAPKTGT